MDATFGTPTSLVEISIACKNLKDADVFSKSDPMCVVSHKIFGSNRWTELKRTECIQNTLNPEFSTKVSITYHFEEQQHLKFVLYDVDSVSSKLYDHDFLGECEITLGQMVSSQVLKKPLSGPQQPGKHAEIILITEELGSCKEEICFRLVGEHIENRHWCSSISPFLEFYKSNDNGTFQLVHRTEPVWNTEDPVWPVLSIQLRTLCNGDYDRNIKVCCKEHIRNGSHKLIGQFYTTVRKLIEGPGFENNYYVINEEKKRRKGSSYKNSGKVIVMDRVEIHQVYSFMDYIRGGTELNAFIAIDFTASNGHPQETKSLHYVNPGYPNQYCQAIQSVGSIIEDYDSDKYFPVLGFGAKLPPNFDVASHEFFVNGEASNPFCFRVQGVLDAYYSCLNYVQLFGPTNFAPVINHVATFASTHRSSNKYFILLILTDGIITDMARTKEAIVNASSLPLSIIIVGVGNANFSAMEELDGDVVRLSSKGRYAERDIVQFVPFSDFIKVGEDPTMARLKLAREVLAEVPDQIVSYMKKSNMAPQTYIPSVPDASQMGFCS